MDASNKMSEFGALEAAEMVPGAEVRGQTADKPWRWFQCDTK